MAEEGRLGTAVAGQSEGENMPEEGVLQKRQGESCGREKHLAGGGTWWALGLRKSLESGAAAACIILACIADCV